MNEMLKPTDRENAMTEKPENLPEEIVNNFEEGDTILITAKNKDGGDFTKICHSLEEARKFFAGDPDSEVCDMDTVELELKKKKEE